MSTNEDLHHKREQNGDEELTSMLQRYLDNSCSNISGSMGKNKALKTGIIELVPKILLLTKSKGHK